jgi:hypothetical protein
MPDHPYDTPLRGGLRFAVEIIAWVAGPWAAAQPAWWLFIPAAIVLIGLPAVFSTKGDKKQVVVATPGPVRVLIELGLHAVALAAPWVVWPVPVAAITSIAVVAALIVGIPRLGWLVRGAPIEPN